jgi:hypothetical protein
MYTVYLLLSHNQCFGSGSAQDLNDVALLGSGSSQKWNWQKYNITLNNNFLKRYMFQTHNGTSEYRTELTRVPPGVSSALSFIGGAHICARALHVLNSIWFCWISPLSQWGGGVVISSFKWFLPAFPRVGGDVGRHPVTGNQRYRYWGE